MEYCCGVELQIATNVRYFLKKIPLPASHRQYIKEYGKIVTYTASHDKDVPDSVSKRRLLEEVKDDPYCIAHPSANQPRHPFRRDVLQNRLDRDHRKPAHGKI